MDGIMRKNETMDEYIKREAVISYIAELFTICNESTSDEYGHHFIVEKELQVFSDNVVNIPAADVAPVVRCRVCQNSYEWTNADRDTYRYCGYLRDRWNHDYDRMVDDDDFCKWGIEQGDSNG